MYFDLAKGDGVAGFQVSRNLWKKAKLSWIGEEFEDWISARAGSAWETMRKVGGSSSPPQRSNKHIETEKRKGNSSKGTAKGTRTSVQGKGKGNGKSFKRASWKFIHGDGIQRKETNPLAAARFPSRKQGENDEVCKSTEPE